MDCGTLMLAPSAYKAWVGLIRHEWSAFLTDVGLHLKSSNVACRTKLYGLGSSKRTNSSCGKLPHSNHFCFLFSKTCFWEYKEKLIFLYFLNQKHVWLARIKKKKKKFFEEKKRKY